MVAVAEGGEQADELSYVFTWTHDEWISGTWKEGHHICEGTGDIEEPFNLEDVSSPVRKTTPARYSPVQDHATPYYAERTAKS